MNIVTKKIEKYPWLTKYYRENFPEVSVERVLDYQKRPRRISLKTMISGFIWGEEDDHEEILLLDENGEKLLRVGEFQRLSNPVTWRWFKPEMYRYFDVGETIDEAISRVPKERDICYVLNVSTRTLYLLIQ